MIVSLVIDMNLSVEWVPFLAAGGWDAVHWSNVGDPRAEDHEVMAWALAQGRMVFTHDLDFGTMLALNHAGGPSVLQIRGRNVLPEDVGAPRVCRLEAIRSRASGRSAHSRRNQPLTGARPAVVSHFPGGLLF